ncbi:MULTISPECIES: glycoside hydrolase N-terminal domain-containing protein [unclassified Mucilaginibacter]
MGGMVFGGVATEHVQFNEISLWTGDRAFMVDSKFHK